MNTPQPLLFARAGQPIGLLPAMANRHGLISGATGTGKTVTLRVLAERFSAAGVPVFMADVKGDLSGLAQAGAADPRMEGRARELGLEDYRPEGFPVAFLDLFGASGHPVRTTVSEMGPLLLSRLLDLNEIQTGVLNLVFQIADDQGLLLLDLKDLANPSRWLRTPRNTARRTATSPQPARRHPARPAGHGAAGRGGFSASRPWTSRT